MLQIMPPIKALGGVPKDAEGKPIPPPPGRKPAQVQMFSPGALNSVPEERIKQWKAVPLLNADNTQSLLLDVMNGKSLPAPFRRAAIRAGTTPEQLLLQQVDFYPNAAFQPTPAQRKAILSKGNISMGVQQSIQGAAPAPLFGPLSAASNAMVNMLTGTAPAYAKTFDPATDNPFTGESYPTGEIGGSAAKLRRALINQESGGNYRAVNPDSGALGIGQVMPANVGPWTKKYLGRALTPQQFLNSKSAQDAVINGRMRDMIADQERAGFKGEVAIRRAAAVWYSGQAGLWNDNTPQYTKGRRYPSIAEYTRNIWRMYRSY